MHFHHSQLDHHGPTDRRTNGRTDGRTDKASYRVACPQLKSIIGGSTIPLSGETATPIKQVTRGHNIVADGWAGASNPNPHHKSPTHMHKKHLKRSFPHFSTRAYGPTDRPTNGRTDKASYRVACPQLKRILTYTPLTRF